MCKILKNRNRKNITTLAFISNIGGMGRGGRRKGETGRRKSRKGGFRREEEREEG